MTKPFTPVPKPESTKKSKGKGTKSPTKTVNMEAVAEKKTRQQQNNINRQAGKAAEIRIAKKTGGTRIPMSGAIKMGNFNLTGDVVVRDANHQNMMKLEVKTSAILDAKGDKQITIKSSWLLQMLKEGHEAHEIPALAFHFKGDTRDWFIFSDEDIISLIEKAKLGCLYEAMIEKEQA